MASISPDGSKWRVQIRRKGFPSQARSFSNRAKAIAWATDVEAKMNNAEYRVSGQTTLRPLVEMYRDEVAPNLKGSRQLVIRINRMLNNMPFLDKAFAHDLSPDIRRWRDKRLKQISYRKKPISNDTVRRELSDLSAIIRHAKEEWNLKGVNPVAEVKLPPKGKRRTRRPTEVEMNKLYTSTKFDGVTLPRTGQGRRSEMVGWMIALAIETAMRLGELTALRVEDVHVAERYVMLHKTKNGDSREVTLTLRAAELFERLMPAEGLVFDTTSERAGAIFRKLCKDNGVVGLRFHDLRHEAITRITNKVKNAAQAAMFSGHRDPRSLMGYYHPSREERAAILDA